MIRTGLKMHAARLVTALSALALAACATQPPPAAMTPAEARPALWRLADEDTTIYLFGTIHLLPAGLEWRTGRLGEAIAASDELVLEVADGDDAAAGAATMMRLGMSPGLPPLAERVPADRRAALAGMIAESGVPAAGLDMLETWAASLLLLAVGFKRLGLDPSLGVETDLTASYKQAGKPIGGLETVEQQLGFFDTLAEEEQRALLVSILDEPETVRAEFAAMLEAWRTGDVEAVGRTFDQAEDLSAALKEVLITRRNAAWADWLQRRLGRPGTLLVAVGAGHLAGRDSVRDRLAAKGLRVERVQ